jgi:glycosyltransferase involved in cell wall biosynthesis
VAEISRRTPVELRLVENVGYKELQAEIAGATVVVDQVNAASTGVLALESMALGVPVLAEYDPDVLAPFQQPAPVVRVTPATLADELERLLGDHERQRALAEAGRRYVEDVHAPERVAAALLRVYEQARSGPHGLFEATPDALRPLHGARPVTATAAAVEEGVA